MLPETPQIDLIFDRAINYAFQQNAIPLVRELRFKNDITPRKNLILRVTTEPAFAEPVEIRLQSIDAEGEFRAAPLWGIGQRLYFLHDGRTSDLGEAIEAHASPGATCATQQDYQRTNAEVTRPHAPGAPPLCASEANAVVDGYNALDKSQQTDLLSFLRSL